MALATRKGHAASVKRQSRQRLRRERRYRRNRSVRFYRHLARTGSAFPRLPRRFAPRNDNLGECRGAPAPLHGLIPLYKALTARKGHAASVRRQSRQRLRRERRCRRNWCVPFSRRPVRIGSTQPGPAVRSLYSARPEASELLILQFSGFILHLARGACAPARHIPYLQPGDFGVK